MPDNSDGDWIDTLVFVARITRRYYVRVFMDIVISVSPTCMINCEPIEARQHHYLIGLVLAQGQERHRGSFLFLGRRLGCKLR